MSTNQTFSCYLIGADTLLIECGEILLAKNHRILGVISSAQRITQWAQSKSLPIISSEKGYADKLKETEFDCLFSITHLAIIDDEVLALPQKGAINFHDGPLPGYAGLNTPAWALINGEEQYGISWHRMTPGVDEGEILKQSLFEVVSDETSLSLNTRCFAAALDSFPELVDELAKDSISPIAQDLSQRSYFGKFKRPDANGLLPWHKSAIKLESLVRALDFGDYPNPLASAKLQFQEQVFCVTGAVARDVSVVSSPGQIVEIEEDQIDVATGEGILSLIGFKDLNGNSVTPGELQKILNLGVGDYFEVTDDNRIEEINALGSELARSDEFWTLALAQLDPVELPYSKADATGSSDLVDYSILETNLPSRFDDVIGNLDLSEAVASSFAILLGRLSRKHEFDLAFVNGAIGRPAQAVPGLFNNYGVLHFRMEPKDSALSVLESASAQIEELSERGAWAKDIIARTPILASIPELVSATALPVAIAIGTEEPVEGSILTLCVAEDGSKVQVVYDSKRLADNNAEKLIRQFESMLANISNAPQNTIGGLELLTQEEKEQLLETWNDNAVDYDDNFCIHHLFEQRVQQHPEATALVFEDNTLSYAELNTAANRLAMLLIGKGIGCDDLVGVHVNRSLDLMVATLGVQKAGAAYVPLDPDFPSERIAFMVEDAGVSLIVTQESIKSELPESKAEIICVDGLDGDDNDPGNPDVAVDSSSLAYVIYTSGSTGQPKGVMVEHRNVTNFFTGMDDRIDHDPAGTWLAVTSLSFDISALELFWTLTRGFKVVIYREDRSGGSGSISRKDQRRPMEFGMFMWGNDDAQGSSKYKLMLDGARYFDENGFSSVWTPERHFSAFGGPYPNPSVTGAAIAAITKNISIRSGSIVSPLHHPIRIAEDWSVVDNISDGRVALSFASGWQPNDFVIRPENHKNNKQIMLEQIETVKKLWRGEKVAFENPMGDMVEVSTLPRPVQKELPVWLTTAGNPESYRAAGKMGVNVLTHLLGQSVEELAEKIQIYREAREEAGFDPETGKVSLMLHAFVGESDAEVRELVREPMKDYLRSAMKIVIDFAWSFPAFKRPGGADAKPEDINIKGLTEEESETILDFAFERYFETSGLFGTPETCSKMVDRCKGAKVDEIACLLDFGVDTETVMDSLPLLKEVRNLANAEAEAAEDLETLDQSLAAQLERHQVTHFQCTPSMARMLCIDPEAKKQLTKLNHMMVGGEAFPGALSKDLAPSITGRLTNMYGPTETTIWSTTQEVGDSGNIPIGRPIANTDIYILDENHHPVPVGVAGDLFIGGRGVVRGYHNRPDLNEERFIPNPFRNDGSRLYWTGDLAQYREDGVIEFLGRVDHQVKIRGYRIELGEIETVLGTHSGVSDCVMLLREDNPDDQRLVAYIVPNGAAPDTNEIREHLRRNLPEYMVPNDVVVLDALPLTPNGKLDRNQLPAPGQSLSSAATYEAPKDEMQQTIVDIWQDTLKLEQVGVNDNFFDLGGHSLLIVRVHQLLKARVDNPISLTDLYRFPTIKSLTEFLESGGKNESLKKSSDRASRRRKRLGLRERGRK